jgi:hypothetical protein
MIDNCNRWGRPAGEDVPSGRSTSTRPGDIPKGIDMKITPVTPAKPPFPTAGDTPNDKPPTRIGSDFVSAGNIPLKTRVLAALGNDKARIALATLRGDVGKLEALHQQATAKYDAACMKLVRKSDDVTAATARENTLRGYDRSTPLQYLSQKYHNENVARHEDALDAVRTAQRKVKDQSNTVERYFDRMAMTFQAIRNLEGGDSTVG